MAKKQEKNVPIQDEPVLDRMPPQDNTAEKAVLGSMLIAPEAVGKALEILQSDDFYKGAHREIFRVMQELFAKTEPIDILTVGDALQKEKKLEEIGGNYFLTQLSNNIPSAANVEYHARIVLEKSLLRRLINISTEISGLAYESSEKASELIDTAEQKIFALSERGLRKGFRGIGSIIKETFETIEKYHSHHKKGALTGVPSGFKKLDELTSGFQPSDLIIIAGRPSMGKTAFCLNIGGNAAVLFGVGVAIFSLEMASYQLALRLLCSEARVDAQKVRTGSLEPDKWTRLADAAGRLHSAPVFIDDTPGISILELRAKARRLKAEHDVGLIIVDYLQLLHGPRNESRQQEISMISQSLKALAKELNVPVIALSQLSRAVESRTDKRPMLSDLRESGAIEQDADVVMFVFREDFYGPAEHEGLAEIIIGKQRNGPIGNVNLLFQKRFVRFENLEMQHEDMQFPAEPPAF